MSEIRIGDMFSPYWKVTSTLSQKGGYEIAPRDAYVIVDLYGDVTLRLGKNFAKITGGGFSGSSSGTKTFKNGKGDEVRVERSRKK